LKCTEKCNSNVDLGLEIDKDVYKVVPAAYVDRNVTSNILNRINEMMYHSEPRERCFRTRLREPLHGGGR
jgi:hypothetical protein